MKIKFDLRILLCLSVLSLILAPTSVLFASDGYLSNLSKALDYLESGKTREASALLVEATVYDANDPLVRVTRGYTFLLGGRASLAKAEFDAARMREPGCAEAEYGIGLIYLSTGKMDVAMQAFASAQVMAPQISIRASMEYVKMLSAGKCGKIEPSNDNALEALRAYQLAQEGRSKEAAEVWRSVLVRRGGPDYRETPGCGMSFIKNVPIVITGWPLRDTEAASLALPKKTTMVSGITTLRADLAQARSVRMVTFFVDNRIVSITNQQPFAYKWDSVSVANGYHNIRIDGVDELGAMVSSKTAWVMVANKPETPIRASRDAAAGPEWEKIRQLMRLQPSAIAANYEVALCASRLGDKKAENIALERVMACNPDFLDVRRRMISLVGARFENIKNYNGNGSTKRVALTFDDGPTQETKTILDELKAKDAKATFFVVGSGVEAFPQLVKRMADEGHDVQNHTFRHRALSYISEREIEMEYFSTSCAIRALIGKGTQYLRPPGGNTGGCFYDFLRRYGIRTVFWTINAQKVERTTQQRIISEVVGKLSPGAIILLHNKEMLTIRALPELIDAIRMRGFVLTTASDILK